MHRCGLFFLRISFIFFFFHGHYLTYDYFFFLSSFFHLFFHVFHLAVAALKRPQMRLDEASVMERVLLISVNLV